MKIQLRFFASVRESLGLAHEILDLPADITTVGELRQLLQSRGGVWQETLAEQRALRMAYDHVLCDAQKTLAQGCEVAFFPPVTGG
jgi:molybdopterin synthase sulfur carrier subunit